LAAGVGFEFLAATFIGWPAC